MSKFTDEVFKEVMILQRDSLIEQIEFIEDRLGRTLSFTEDRNHLMKLYLNCDEKLKEVNKYLDDFSGKSDIGQKLGDPAVLFEEVANV